MNRHCHIRQATEIKLHLATWPGGQGSLWADHGSLLYIPWRNGRKFYQRSRQSLLLKMTLHCLRLQRADFTHTFCRGLKSNVFSKSTRFYIPSHEKNIMHIFPQFHFPFCNARQYWSREKGFFFTA
jgi:hypothetical protein